MTIDPTKEKWVEENGSVFTERTFQYKSDFGVKYKARISIMFNVGTKVARHIVRLHNQSLGV